MGKIPSIVTIYKHLLFDLDRTLWDFEANTLETFQELYLEYKLYKHFDCFDQFFDAYRTYNDTLWEEYRQGRIAKDLLRWKRFHLVLLDRGIDSSAMASAIGEDYVKNSPLKKRLFPGTIETLSELKKKYRLHIVTNGFTEVQYVKLRNCKLEQFFEKVFTSEELGYQKPHAEFFHLAISALHARKRESLVIGDDFKVDIAGAKNAGIDQVYFNPKNSVAQFVPTYEIKNLPELLDFL